MSVQVKKFNFLSFEEWDKVKDTYYEESIGNYEVQISKFFDYYAVFTNFPSNHIKWFDFDEKQGFKVWYEEACAKVNEDFENYIRTYLVEE